MPEGRVVYAVNWLDSVPEQAALSMERVRRAGFEAYVHPTPRNLNEAEVIGILPNTVGVIAGSHRFTAKALGTTNKLRAISRHGAGFESIDLDYCTEHGIVVTNAFGVNAGAVAEFTLALILAVVRDIPGAADVLRSGNWADRGNASPGTTLGRTLGIIGFGAIGQALAGQARGLGMKIIYTDIRRIPEAEAAYNATFVTREELLKQADVVSLHVALNPNTHHMIDEAQFRLMKRTAVLVNTSRGGVVNEDALYRAIRDGVIAGGALDVYESEPPATDSPLFTLKRGFIGTPHVAGVSSDAKVAMLDAATTNLLDVLQGRRPPKVTNPAVYERHPELGAGSRA
ncbi:MAG: phosphoglycerate dehydrogenase [Bauldia sp.]